MPVDAVDPNDLAALRTSFEMLADPAKGVEMRRYMRDRFPFLGVSSPERRRAQRDWIARLRTAPIDDVLAAAEACWREPEREFQYAAADLLRRHAKRVEPRHLPAVRGLIERGAWWDVVDSLAPHVVGSLVGRHPELVAEMDRWVLDDDMWVVRSAILHQLTYGDGTDADRLFRYCEQQAGHPDFFVRKAIGWALRQYARVAPDAVRDWVADHEPELSELSVREATKHLR